MVAGNMAYAAAQWLVLLVISKLGNNLDVGRYTLAMSICTPLFMLSNLQLRNIEATDTRVMTAFSYFFGMRLFCSLIAFLMVALIATFHPYGSTTTLVILGIAVAKVLDSLSDIAYGAIQRNEFMHYVGRSLIIRAFMLVCSFAVSLRVFHDLTTGVELLALSWLAVLVFYDLRHVSNLEPVIPKLNRAVACRMLKWGFPLGTVMMLVSLSVNIPRYYIAAIYGLRDVGYFSSVTYLMNVGQIFITAVGQSASPRLARLYSESRLEAFMRIVGILVVISLMVGVVGVLISLVSGDTLLALLYNKDTSRLKGLLVLAMIAGCLWYCASVMGIALTSMQKFAVQLPVAVLVCVVSLISSALVIPHAPLYASGFVLVITSAAQLVSSYGFVWWYTSGRGRAYAH